MKSLLLVVCALASLGLAGCERQQPSRQELIGTWTDTRTGAQLNLRSNGEMTLVRWPYSFIADSNNNRPVSAKGGWKWFHEKPELFDDDVYHLSMWTSEIDGRPEMREIIPNYGHDLTGIEITRFRGDPDDGHALRFVKTSNKD
ncbi:MAG: hypothetical protein ACREEB_01250 [Caulobacteraceae bacterium]